MKIALQTDIYVIIGKDDKANTWSFSEPKKIKLFDVAKGTDFSETLKKFHEIMYAKVYQELLDFDKFKEERGWTVFRIDEKSDGSKALSEIKSADKMPKFPSSDLLIACAYETMPLKSYEKIVNKYKTKA